MLVLAYYPGNNPVSVTLVNRSQKLILLIIEFSLGRVVQETTARFLESPCCDILHEKG